MCLSPAKRWSPASCSRISRKRSENLADPELYDAIIVTNLCVPTASGVPLRLLKKDINGVRIIGIDVPGFGIPTHAEAKDVLAGAMLQYAREEVKAGPVRRPARTHRQTHCHLAWRDVPGRSGGDFANASNARPLPPGRWCRPANGVNFTPRSIAPFGRRDPPVLHRQRSANSKPRAARS